MSLSQRFFTEALRDMQQTMSMLEQPLFNAARRSLVVPNRGGFPSLLNGNFPATDMVEHSDSYELQAELPGIKKEDVQIELSDSQTLVLKGSINQEVKKSSQDEATATETTEVTAAENEPSTQVTKAPETAESIVKSAPPKQQWWVNERVSGSFSRTFTFPTPIKAEEIKAKYEDGVLKINVPKSVKQVHQINIE